MAKYIDTPAGKFQMPRWAENRLAEMTDLEILEEYVVKCRSFIDPFLFQEMCDRGLTVRGDYYQDIVDRLEAMKAAQREEGQDTESAPSAAQEPTTL